jgi:hypothetical protein
MSKIIQPIIILTRYLYIKDEVEYALVLSLINQNKSCLFWAYELYHSGFQLELFDLLWKTYDEFYSRLNPNFKSYFEKKQEEWLTKSLNVSERDEVIIGNIVHNLMRRDSEVPKQSTKKENQSKQSKQSTKKENQSNKSKQPTKKEKRLYVVLNEDELTIYKTITISKDIKSYQILQKALLYNSNESKSLNLFPLKRRVVSYDDLKNMYHDHWEYYASFSPLWRERFAKYGGLVSHDERKIAFEDEQLSQEFYENYGYEPDDQSSETQEKNIPLINFTSEILSNNDGLLICE